MEMNTFLISYRVKTNKELKQTKGEHNDTILRGRLMRKTRRFSKFSYFVIVYLLPLIFFCSCEDKVEQKSTTKLLGGSKVEIVIFDNCEYIDVNRGQASWGSHKGNCKFCAERNKNKEVSNEK